MHFCLSALIPPGKVQGLCFALRQEEKYQGSSRAAPRQRQAHPAVPHRNLHTQVAELRAAVPGHWYRCNSPTNRHCAKHCVYNELQTGQLATNRLTRTNLSLNTLAREFFCILAKPLPAAAAFGNLIRTALPPPPGHPFGGRKLRSSLQWRSLS